MSTHIEISSADISERLVGITPVYLQNFIQRGSYGIRASVQPGEVRAQHRRFSRDDVFGIALVWLLFEAGLRGDPIARTLSDIAGTRKPNANSAAKKLLECQAEYFVVLRQPRPPSKHPLRLPDQATKIVSQADARNGMPRNPSACELVVAVGEKFRDIEQRLKILFEVQ